MPWWSWLLIWSGLALVLLGVLTWFAVQLYRKALGTLQAFEALSDQVAGLSWDSSSPPALFKPAVFADLKRLRREVEQRRAERTHRRQMRRDGLIVRGKLMRNAR